MQGGRTTTRFAGATASQPCAVRFRGGVSGLGADSRRGDSHPHPPSLRSLTSHRHRRRRPESSPCGLETSAKLLRHGCSLMSLNGTQHSDRWLTGVGATPTRALCIADRTPLALVRDASMVQDGRAPACVRSRWGRVTSPSPQDMQTNAHQPESVDDSTDPGSPGKRVAEAKKQLRIALGDLQLDTAAKRNAANEIEDALEGARNADELLNGGSE